METMQAILTRNSTREYLEKIIPSSLIEKLLKAGMNAPSANNLQPNHYVIINDKKALKNISDLHPHGKMCKYAPVVILICADTSKEKNIGYCIQDCSASCENILIAANDIGLGGVWLGVYPREERMNQISSLLKRPKNIMPCMLIPIGFPKGKEKEKSNYSKEKIHYNFW